MPPCRVKICLFPGQGLHRTEAEDALLALLRLPRFNPKELAHFLITEALVGTVWLHPFAIYDELGNGALADILFNFFGRAGGALNVDLLEGDVVLFQEVLGLPAVPAPEGGIDGEIHVSMVTIGTKSDRSASKSLEGTNNFVIL